MAYSIKAGQITEEERKAAREKGAFQSGGSYEYLGGDSNNGFQDAYNELVRRMRHTKQMYQDQLKGLSMREEELSRKVKETRKTVWIILTISIILALFYAFKNRIAELAVLSDFTGAVTFLLNLFIPGVILFLVFIMLPVYLVQLFKAKRARKILSGKGLRAAAAREKGIITFVDERSFLMTRITNIDNYMDQLVFHQINVDTENLRQMDLTNVLHQQGIWETTVEDSAQSYTGVLKKDDTDNRFGEDRWTEEERDIIARMRSLSLFREYRAGSAESMTEVSFKWMALGGLAVIAMAVFFYYSTRK